MTRIVALIMMLCLLSISASYAQERNENTATIVPPAKKVAKKYPYAVHDVNVNINPKKVVFSWIEFDEYQGSHSCVRIRSGKVKKAICGRSVSWGSRVYRYGFIHSSPQKYKLSLKNSGNNYAELIPIEVSIYNWKLMHYYEDGSNGWDYIILEGIAKITINKEDFEIKMQFRYTKKGEKYTLGDMTCSEDSSSHNYCTITK